MRANKYHQFMKFQEQMFKINNPSCW